MADEQDTTTSSITREHLLTGVFGAHVERIEAHRVTLRPGQQAGRHVHPGGVVGYVEDGEIAFEIAGQPTTVLQRGSTFYEPPGTTIARFDNLSDSAAAMFVAFYPLADDQPLISAVDE